MSVEQTNDFHIARRISRIVAPDYRLFATPRIPEYACVLDVARRTIEVGESNDIFQTITVLLFQLGQLTQRKEPRFALFFGDGIRDWQGTPEALIDKLARQGTKVDRAAAAWAASIFRSYWPDHPDNADDLMSQYVWNFAEWKKHFA